MYAGGNLFMVDNQREKTMRDRIGEKASSLVNNSQYLPMVRARQKATTPEEFETIVRLAENADTNPQGYFMSLLSNTNFERTLIHVRRILSRSVEAISYVSRKIGNTSKKYLSYVADKIAVKKYSMSQVVHMVELSISKREPDRYLIGILKNGYSCGKL